MSKIKTQPPIVHTPSFKTYSIAGNLLRTQLLDMGFQLPFGMLDNWYYYTDSEGWGKILYDLTFKSNLYQADKFDCENFALRAMSLCAERYGLNTLGLVIGDTPLGRHGFNLLVDDKGFMLFEPNDGFSFGGLAFPLGDNGYQVDLILI